MFYPYFLCNHIKVSYQQILGDMAVKVGSSKRMFELTKVRDIGIFYEKVLVTVQKECKNRSSC